MSACICWILWYELTCASERAYFSDRQNAISFSPLAIFGSHFFFCSSFAPTRIGNEPSALTQYITPTPPHARDSCSITRQRSRTVPPAPPYSFGIHTPKKPASASASLISHGYSWSSSYFRAS